VKDIKICIVASAGGHLQECNQLFPIFSKYDYFYITFAKEEIVKSLKGKVYIVTNPDIRNPKLGVKAAIKNLFEVLKILLKERPNVIITSGASIAIPVCILAKILFRSKIIFIETISRFHKPSLTGRILYWVADLFLVQWKSLLRHYGKKAIYGGPLI
jgi:UDP-N-acetylglucosamine:LPS N-acetylglucosamine transferase